MSNDQYQTHGYYTVDHFGDPNNDSLYAVKIRDTGRWVSRPMVYLEADNLRIAMNAAFLVGLREGQNLREPPAGAYQSDSTP